MNNLFYTEKDSTLFWIAGYTWDGNTSFVIEQIKSLQENAQKFADISQVYLANVKTHFVEKSSRYKYMRVFYVNDFPMSKVPKEFYIINHFRANPYFKKDEPVSEKNPELLGDGTTMWEKLEY